MTQKPGLFITFEGIDGSGKTTQAELLYETFRKDYPVILTREPGGTPIGQKIRSLILDSDDDLAPETQLMLMLADRAEHVSKIINPALAAKKIVLCDRYIYSTVAYQGFGLKLGHNQVLDAHQGLVSLDLPEPDATLLLDLAFPLVAARLVMKRKDRYEKDVGFTARVWRGYARMGEGKLDNFYKIDAGRDKSTVASEIETLVRDLIHKKKTAGLLE